MRAVGGIVYLLATAYWAFFMAMVQGLTCDDSCTAPQFAQDWGDNRDAWQYGVVGWLGAAGLGLAIIALALSLVRRWLGMLVLTLHGAVFTINCLVFYLGRHIYGSFVPFALGASLVAAAGFTAVGGRFRAAREAPNAHASQ